MPNHGEYNPAKGWYDSSTKAWHATPDKITQIDPGKPVTDDTRAQFDGWTSKKDDRDPEMDRLIAMRDSDRLDERQRYERAVAGTNLRLKLGTYEQLLAERESA